MKGYVIVSFIGLLLCNDEGKIIDKALFPKETRVQADKLHLLSRGEVIDEVKELCEKARSLGIDQLVLENPLIAKAFAGYGFHNVKVEAPNDIAKIMRSQLLEIAVRLGYALNEDEAVRMLHEVTYNLSARKIVEAVEKRDLLVAQAVSCLDEIEKVLNILASRLREWYGVHFPELGNLVKDHEDFIKALLVIGHRDNIKKREVLEKLSLIRDKVHKLIESPGTSLGADVLPKDVEIIKEVASITLNLYDLNSKLRRYVDEVMGEVAPNVKELIGPVLGARLISLAGGLERLAKLPASTIQLLGAEKALFRALRTGTKPPKHGIIFQYPEVHKSPKWQRGKIARALAGKIAIAARVDYFTGEYVADELKEDLEKRIKEIKEVYKEPPKKVVERRPKKAKKR
ncbi:MAG: C/D box methylation guide ribonucleoprotein complex aNOP56 subunit [Candidatus Nezhaarchaeota archaeon]|nr:C/D box methylation guide ribonucleoprotein complex aNOP56 subunit [Candidatus Nezhaarchaeota archaeon]MCX8141979.1 C/D box methylation guide ribonucleoprotein complex aNOP56 subunit [Candidatus Nezhaarchaeota archaeon]MDW8050240.1 C/D box methylation guide ribonucleoprotein complex aNOP56 subunit [Nitrososphaerota archaeon]